jgi:hypothetical protein
MNSFEYPGAVMASAWTCSILYRCARIRLGRFQNPHTGSISALSRVLGYPPSLIAKVSWVLPLVLPSILPLTYLAIS